MKVVDCHVHMEGGAKAADILRRMDANGVHRTIILSPLERKSLRKTRENLLAAKKVMDADPARLSGLAWLNPTIKGMAALADEALTDLGFSGIKIIPDHWFVYEKRLEPFWKKLDSLKASVLFHTGILYLFEDGSRFNRPAYLEKLYHYPRVRFAMAHISWPWCDECLAVMGRMRSASRRDKGHIFQSYIDLTPGTPRYIRKQAIANAVDFLGGVDHILWGSDDSIPGEMAHQGKLVKSDLAIFDEIGLDASAKERIFSGTADELFPARA